MKKENAKPGDTSTRKRPAVDPTDPRQAALLSGGITGAVAGAAVGSLAGPLGTIAGSAVGGVIGAKTAEDIAIDTAAEEHHWKKNWQALPYVEESRSYEDYEPAFRAGYDIPDEIYSDQTITFEDAEDELRERYESAPAPTIPWEDARPAARDAFDRVIDRRNRRLQQSDGTDIAPTGTSLDPTKPGIS